jgi:hypothetical protein
MLIDVSVPPDNDVMTKEVEGILKYEDLLIVVQRVKYETENDTNYHRCDWNFVKNVSDVRIRHPW